jgi:hypothetical protein
MLPTECAPTEMGALFIPVTARTYDKGAEPNPTLNRTHQI